MAATLQMPDDRSFTLDRPVIMGILNVTPDSFSDGGLYGDVDAAVAHGLQMLDQGADMIDVGGESTRPGSKRVEATEQIKRVVPVIGKLCQQVSDVKISIDTTQSDVGRAAIKAGAVMLNDVSAGGDDPAMFQLAAQSGTPLVLTHMQGNPQTMQHHPQYADVVGEIETFLAERASAAMAAGMARQQILIDPGIGFGKTLSHNLTLLAHLDRLVAMGFPVVLGTSRKRFMSEICRGQPDRSLRPRQWIGSTCATTALGVAAGVSVFRVHDVRDNRQAADTAWAITRASAVT